MIMETKVCTFNLDRDLDLQVTVTNDVCLAVCRSQHFVSHALTQKLLLWSVTQVWSTTKAN